MPVFECHLDNIAYDTMVMGGEGLIKETWYRHINICVTKGTTVENGIKITSCVVDTINETMKKDTTQQEFYVDGESNKIYLSPTHSIITITARATRFICGTDSISSTDSIMRITKEVIIADTLIDTDTCRPFDAMQQTTDLQYAFCWRGACTYQRYAGVSARYTDSAANYDTLAFAARTDCANAYGQARFEETNGNVAMANYYDSIAQEYGQLARAYEATAAAWHTAAVSYYDREYVAEYAIDTLHIGVKTTLGNGCTTSDTITAIRIPVEYTLQPTDTNLQAERPVYLEANAPNSKLEWQTVIGYFATLI